MTRTLTTLLMLSTLAACGGGSGTGSGTAGPEDPSLAPSVQHVTDAITPDSALLALSIADLAVTRLQVYDDFAGAVDNQMYLQVADSARWYANQDGEVSCLYSTLGQGDYHSSGRVTVTSVASGSYAFNFKACATAGGLGIAESGTAATDRLVYADDGRSSTFNLKPQVKLVEGNDGNVVSGETQYALKLPRSSGAMQGTYKTHTGQLDYFWDAKTDQYREIGLTIGYSGSTGELTHTIHIESLAIATPRFPASTLLVTTPAALTSYVGSREGSVSGILKVVSASDGSRAEAEFLTKDAFRVRVWDSRGNLISDTTKSSGDADVLGAEILARD